MVNKTLKLLKKIYQEGKINKHQLKTYRGQCLNGDVEGCLKGLSKKGLI